MRDGFSIQLTTVLVSYPDISVGYSLSGLDGSRFCSVTIPGALPNGDAQFEIEIGGLRETILAGQTIDLLRYDPNGVADFRVLGIDPSENLSPDDPSAFVIGLDFAGFW